MIRTVTVFFAVTLCLGGALAQDVEVSGVPDDAPYRVVASVDRARLVIDLAFEEGWHAYARDVGGGAPLELFATDAADGAHFGALRFPESDDGELAGNVRLVQWLTLPADESRVDATLSLTVCDALQCLNPTDIRLTATVAPLKLLVVVDTEDERARRIGEFFAARGFGVEMTTYEAVTAEECDANDLVVADSKLYRAARGLRERVADFPRTRTPIVAVGLLGTELVKAHGLAMTSGYI